VTYALREDLAPVRWILMFGFRLLFDVQELLALLQGATTSLVVPQILQTRQQWLSPEPPHNCVLSLEISPTIILDYSIYPLCSLM